MLGLSRLIALSFAGCLLSASVDASEIRFEINGIKEAQGKLYIQLFQGEQNYQSGEAQVSTAVMPNSESTIVTFNDIEPGEYALRFYHDEDNNGEMATNFFGLPTEGYGFSNNAKPNFGPVSYDEIRFVVSEKDEVVTNSTYVIY